MQDKIEISESNSENLNWIDFQECPPKYSGEYIIEYKDSAISAIMDVLVFVHVDGMISIVFENKDILYMSTQTLDNKKITKYTSKYNRDILPQKVINKQKVKENLHTTPNLTTGYPVDSTKKYCIPKNCRNCVFYLESITDGGFNTIDICAIKGITCYNIQLQDCRWLGTNCDFFKSKITAIQDTHSDFIDEINLKLNSRTKESNMLAIYSFVLPEDWMD